MFTLSHVHLKVRDLDRAVRFYTETFGLTVSEQVAGRYAFLSDGKVHHVIALQSVGSAAPNAPARSVGLYHTAFEVADKSRFAEVFHALQSRGVETIAVDHQISWAMYFDDPDGNGWEIFADTRSEPGNGGEWAGVSRPLAHDTIRAAAS